MALDLRSARPQRLLPPGMTTVVPVCDAPPAERLIPFERRKTPPRAAVFRALLAVAGLTALALALAAGVRA